MKNKVLRTEINIRVPMSQAWNMFADPDFTHKMGGEYVSEWSPGSSIQWKGMNGQVITNGTILEINNGSFLKFNLFESIESKSVLAIITYILSEQNGITNIQIEEAFSNPISNIELSDSLEGWNAALNMVKELMER